MTDTSLQLNTAECAIAYREGRHDHLANLFLALLDKFRINTYFTLDDKTTHFVNVFVKHFLFYFSQEDFNPTQAQLVRFVELNPVICNVAAMSVFRDTDAHLQILLGQQRNFAKTLALYNPRCQTRLDRKRLFDASSALATTWYYAFFENYRVGNVTRNCWEQMRDHLYFQDERLTAVTAQMHHAFFGATYVDFEQDYSIKQVINRSVRNWIKDSAVIDMQPIKRKACVITQMWFKGHSVYRCMHKFLETLAEDFELTLISLSNPNNVDAELFAGGVRHFTLADPQGFAAVSPSPFELAFYPDIGMNLESITLSNLRIAPVQVCGYGHPVSTWGSEIDYWLGGIDTEDAESATQNYAERLVLIPGAGVMPNKPRYERRWNHQASSVVRINCSWTGQKINFLNLTLLRRIAELSQNPVHYRFFPGGSVMSGAYLALRREIGEVLGPDVGFQVFGTLNYDTYMAVMEDAEFTLDPYPFGGYATATDALFLGKPIVTLEGKKFFNRSAASLLYKCGLEDLVAKDADAYVAAAVRLVDDIAFRQEKIDLIENSNLDETIFADDSSKPFKSAMNYLVKHQDRLKQETDRTPLVFK
jgi:hypothetical protein